MSASSTSTNEHAKKKVVKPYMFKNLHDLNYSASGNTHKTVLTSYGAVLSLLSPAKLIVYEGSHLTIPDGDQPNYVHRKDKKELITTPGQLLVFTAGTVHAGMGREKRLKEQGERDATTRYSFLALPLFVVTDSNLNLMSWVTTLKKLTTYHLFLSLFAVYRT